MKSRLATFLFLALSPALALPAWSGEEIRRSFAEDGTRWFSTESKSDSHGSIRVSLAFHEEETWLVVSLSQSGVETTYDGISVIPRDQADRPLPLKRKSMMSKTYQYVHDPFMSYEDGTYLISEKDAVRMFSVEVIRNGEATMFELHLVR